MGILGEKLVEERKWKESFCDSVFAMCLQHSKSQGDSSTNAKRSNSIINSPPLACPLSKPGPLLAGNSTFKYCPFQLLGTKCSSWAMQT